MSKNRIRMATKEDAKELLEIYAPYVTNTAITFEYTVPTIQEFEKRIENVLKKYPYIVAYNGTEILGYAYASAFHERPACNWAVETSIYVNETDLKDVKEKLINRFNDQLQITEGDQRFNEIPY